jgi:tetratricopeptide (TPR) repeat protein
MQTIPQRLAEAGEHRQAGRLSEAEAIYRAILAETPQNPQVLHLLGTLVHQTGRHEEALGLIARALVAQGPHPMLYANLATVCLALDRLDEAERNCRLALELQPDLANAHFCLGVVHYRRGQHAEAEAAFRAAARHDPRRGDARRRMEARPPEQLFAIVAQLRDRTEAEPANDDLRRELAMALLSDRRPEEAKVAIHEALRLRPDVADSHGILGLAHQQLEEMAEAAECFRAAIRLNPAHIQARCDLGHALDTLGRTEEAVEQYRAVLAQEPNHAQAFSALSKLVAAGHDRFSEEELRRFETMASRPDLSLPDQCRLHYALAQVLERNGDPAVAFEHARLANAARAEFDRVRGHVFDPDEHRRYIERLIAMFTPEYFARTRSFGSNSELPVFVIGMMRSGTTLTEQILASHPSVHGAGELREMGLASTGMPQRLGTSVSYPECMAQLDAVTAQSTAEAHLRMLKRRGGAALRVVDKYPLNFLCLGTIATLFPHARIIHCNRDPIDTCVSCYFQDLFDPFPFKHNLAHLGEYYRQYQRLLDYWRAALPMPIFELHYEELTAEPEAVSRRLVEFCGLEWDERCLSFHTTERPVRTASMLQVRKPMYRSAVGRWKRYEKQLQPLIDALQQRA